MTDEELIARLRDVYVDNTIRLTAADRIEELEQQLQRVLYREASSIRRHDAKLDAAEAKLAKAAELLRKLLHYVPLRVVECRGDKCREPWCASCSELDDAELEISFAKSVEINARAVLAELETKP